MMAEPSAERLKLPFNRPEYFSVPELLISSLAHRAYERKKDAPPIGKSAADGPSPAKVDGYMYKAKAKQSKFVDVRSTFPESDALAVLGERVAMDGQVQALVAEASMSQLGEAVAQSVLGIRVEKTGNQPASPMSPALALLQDRRGVLVKRNPPDFAEILEAMFAVGGPRGEEGLSATGLWLQAVDQRLEHDPVLREIDRAFMSGILGAGYERRPGDLGHRDAREWAGLFPDTPYSWFARVWSSLTTDHWVDSLPARVWVDWATTVLRLVMGLGFLWEAAWYERIALAVVDKAIPSTFKELVNTVAAPLPWQSSRATVSTRDVASLLKHRLRRGEKVRSYLIERMQEYAKSTSLSEISAVEFLRRLSDEKGHVEVLVKALADARDNSKTVHETVKYGLQVRESSGPYTDYYGILKPHGRRYVLVDPGTEWVTVVGSLACEGTARQCRVGDVLADLSRLGMRPELGDLVSLLERAGMARGSADADNAVIVERAF